MPLFSLLDLLALAFFLFAWGAYTATLNWTERRKRGLNLEMDRYREFWMTEMLARKMRMVDAQIVAALQNGAACLASTSLIAVGGALTLLRSTPEILEVMAALPSDDKSTAVQWEAKSSVCLGFAQRADRLLSVRRDTSAPRPTTPATRSGPWPPR